MAKRIGITLDDIKNSKVASLNGHLLGEPKQPKSKRAKYNNEKVEYEGIVFDSRKEYQRYRELLLLQKAGLIGFLQLQVPFVLIEKSNSERECKYIADFVYIDAKTKPRIVPPVIGPPARRKSKEESDSNWGEWLARSKEKKQGE